jgi:hypothetical protein
MRIAEQRRAYQLSTELGHAVDAIVFTNILESDDDEDQHFSQSLVFVFIELAKHTLDQMDACL